MRLYSVSIGAVTNHHRPSIYLLSYGSGGPNWNGSSWANVEMLAGLARSGSFKKESLLLSGPAFRGCLHSLARGPFLHRQSRQWSVRPFSWCTSCLCLHCHVPCDSCVLPSLTSALGMTSIPSRPDHPCVCMCMCVSIYNTWFVCLEHLYSKEKASKSCSLYYLGYYIKI